MLEFRRSIHSTLLQPKDERAAATCYRQTFDMILGGFSNDAQYRLLSIGGLFLCRELMLRDADNRDCQATVSEAVPLQDDSSDIVSYRLSFADITRKQGNRQVCEYVMTSKGKSVTRFDFDRGSVGYVDGQATTTQMGSAAGLLLGISTGLNGQPIGFQEAAAVRALLRRGIPA